MTVMLSHRYHTGEYRSFAAADARFIYVVGAGAILGCLYLFVSLPSRTQLWFLGWNLVGLAVYFLYARRRVA